MKQNYLSILFYLFTFSAVAQVGIGTTSPKTTLDVVGDPANTLSFDGITAPRLTGDQLKSKNYGPEQNGTMVYVTASSTNLSGQTSDVISEGLYIFNSAQDKWLVVKLASNTSTVEAYGEMYGSNDGMSNSVGSFTRSLDTSTILKNVTHSSTEYFLEVEFSGNYEISYSVALTLNDNTFKTLEFFVERAPGNTTFSRINASRTFETPSIQTGIFNLKKSFLVSLNANDRVRLRYITTVAGNNTFPANTNNLTIKRIGSI